MKGRFFVAESILSVVEGSPRMTDESKVERGVQLRDRNQRQMQKPEISSSRNQSSAIRTDVEGAVLIPPPIHYIVRIQL
ncbi:MAG: hypothetical protein ACRD4B_09220 [Acidobacteriota bacterium]